MDEFPFIDTPPSRLQRPRRRIDYANLSRLPEYDPLDYGNLARSCVLELLNQPVHTLPLEPPFWGAGVYALFYLGDFPAYAPVQSDADRLTQPIYVGKADPAGARKGKKSGSQALRSELWGRIDEHTWSIGAVQNLRLEDFRCRYLVVKPIWIRMVERFLIEDRKPAWNGCLDGFGLHDPGGERSPIVSWWDAMHPGRPHALGWKARIQYIRTQADAERHLREWLDLPPEERPVILDEEEGAESS